MRLSLRLFCLETELKIQFVDLKQKNGFVRQIELKSEGKRVTYWKRIRVLKN